MMCEFAETYLWFKPFKTSTKLLGHNITDIFLLMGPAITISDAQNL
jgi:hypothetical protein